MTRSSTVLKYSFIDPLTIIPNSKLQNVLLIYNFYFNGSGIGMLEGIVDSFSPQAIQLCCAYRMQLTNLAHNDDLIFGLGMTSELVTNASERFR